ncbi:MAG: membrane bound O-acyl transferase family-domain-containing protein [Planctomycetota bacterium]|nr:membrane bound O-acyl transferase family-domain-containing protein [Planctomycetota bacterium]
MPTTSHLFKRFDLARGWLVAVTLPILVWLAVPSDWPDWAWMWLQAIAIYAGCKWLTWRRAFNDSAVQTAPVWMHLGYLFAWPGMDPESFFTPPAISRKLSASAGEWLFALGKMSLGIGLLCFVAQYSALTNPWLDGWIAMIGLVLTLHFGIFHLLSCGWRTIGVNAKPLMNWPILSTSVSEFWGQRWNTAFRDLTYRFLFRPLTKQCGPKYALLLAFLVSGLLHEAVITVPVASGYGGPTLFFLIQAIAMLFERSETGKRWLYTGKRDGRSWRGWLFTAAVILLPAGLLFPRSFATEIILPFVHSWRAVL